jgi:hypothetical protein
MARQFSKADIESSVAVLLNDVKSIKKETAQIAALKTNMDLMIVYLKSLGGKIDDNFQDSSVQMPVTADKGNLLSHADVAEKFKSLDLLVEDIFMHFPVVKEI